MSLSKNIVQISPSPTLAITAKAKKMQSEGINVIGFGAGEPDFDTPVNIKEAAKRAIDKGFTKYTPTAGAKELKDAICKKFARDNQLTYTPEEILVSCGAKHSIFNVVLALCGEGDEVIIPSPYWVSYPEMVKVVGAKSVLLSTTEENGFKITPEQLDAAITPKTKLFILNSPSNPTGMVYSESELRALSEVVVRRGIFCLSDEIYEKLVYGEKHVSIASFGPEIKKQTIVVNGMSKVYSMTGWRIGYAAGPKEIIQAMSNLQDHSTSNPTSISQAASVEALEGPQDELTRMVDEFTRRRKYMVDRVNSIKGLRTTTPGGAFYCWIDISGLLGKSIEGGLIGNSLQLTEMLLSKAYVAVVPGGVFGDDHYIRLSYATSIENIVEGLNRIESFVKKIA
ncbi:MAG: pyridoxal phosphate-dependent aminotransferase [Candidatus Omnitrophota bacterium]